MAYWHPIASLKIRALVLSCCAAQACNLWPSCDDETVCRTFDVIEWCRGSGECTSTPERQDHCGDSCTIDYFALGSGAKSLVIPLAEVHDEIAGLPGIDIVLRAGAFLDVSKVIIRFDGELADCELDEFSEHGGAWFRCDPASTPDTIEIFANEQDVAFRLEVVFTERTCTLEREVCQE